MVKDLPLCSVALKPGEIPESTKLLIDENCRQNMEANDISTFLKEVNLDFEQILENHGVGSFELDYRINEFEEKLKHLQNNVKIPEADIKQAESSSCSTSNRISDIPETGVPHLEVNTVHNTKLVKLKQPSPACLGL